MLPANFLVIDLGQDPEASETAISSLSRSLILLIFSSLILLQVFGFVLELTSHTSEE